MIAHALNVYPNYREILKKKAAISKQLFSAI
jgi:hypothetical protein